MKVIMSEFFAGKSVSVHGDTVVFDGDGLCQGQEDDTGALGPLSQENAETLVSLDYVTVEHREDEAPEEPEEEPSEETAEEQAEEPEMVLKMQALDDLDKDELLVIANEFDLDLERRYSERTIAKQIRDAREE